jgi:predicted dehydrogenase
MIRIGLIGLESSRPAKFAGYLSDGALGGRITAVVASQSDDAEVFRELDCHVLRRPEELLGRVDAVIDCSRRGSEHRKNVEALLRHGIDVWVDKPLAASVADAESLISAAAESGAALMSFSGYRLAPLIPALASRVTVDSGSQRLVVSGPADANCEYDGLFYYGIHHAEVALEVLGRPLVEPGTFDVQVSEFDGGVRADFSLQSTDLALVFFSDERGAALPFTVSLDGGSSELELALPERYNEQMLRQFIAASISGQAPYAANDMKGSVALISAVVERY